MGKEIAILKLIHGKMIDFSFKKHFTPHEWAELIQHYMNAKGYKSIREFVRKENIKRSTVRGWLMPLRLTKEEYQKKVKAGKTKEQIFKEMPKKYYDIDDLIRYFKDLNLNHNNRSEMENKIGTLIVVLMDCLKRK